MTQRNCMQRHRMGKLLGTGAACLSLWAAPLTLAHSASYLTFGVSEGTSGGLDHAQVIAKYEGLANVLSKSLGQKVNVVFVREFKALEAGMKDGRFDFVMARPSDYPARALRDYGYRFVASALPDGQCLIVVPKDSKITSIEGIQGQRIAGQGDQKASRRAAPGSSEAPSGRRRTATPAGGMPRYSPERPVHSRATSCSSPGL